ncbi:MAG: 50S ribosomal protein L4 [Patescibacteria group bacterium]|nr:50S ribosomal protein L4 [Patescibacteria group bacterium]
MAKVKVYNLEGNEAGEVELDKAIFEVPVKEVVIHQVMTVQEANTRTRLAQAKTRSEKRGGGAKPWRQKGTGRARAGSNRSPVWVGGGVTFGPNAAKNFSKKINKKTKQKALKMVLSDKVTNGKMIVLESLEIPELKTKKLAELLNKLPVKGKSVLISAGKKNNNLIKAANNINKTDTTGANSLNVIDLLRNEYLILDKAGLEVVIKTYKK